MVSRRDERYVSRLPGLSGRLRALRLAAGLSQEELAARAKLSVTMVQNLERPSYAGNPRLTTLMALAEAVGSSVPELVDFD